MPNSVHAIEPLARPAEPSDIRSLAQLLVDIVASGEAVSFVSPFEMAQAEAWWTNTLAVAGTAAVFLVARDAEGIVGTVQLHRAWAPNQPHRAEITKLLVHERARRSGIGARLMRTIERAAWDAGITLLTLDAKRGGAAERLYRRMGWIEVGMIPGFAVDPDGQTPHDAVFFYKVLSPAADGQTG
jgi:GNAT superfamily N-acetyltransferase